MICIQDLDNSSSDTAILCRQKLLHFRQFLEHSVWCIILENDYISDGYISSLSILCDLRVSLRDSTNRFSSTGQWIGEEDVAMMSCSSCKQFVGADNLKMTVIQSICYSSPID